MWDTCTAVRWASKIWERLVVCKKGFAMANGFRTQLEWMGQIVETLADLPPQPGRILLLGINPAPPSVQLGHYYQGCIGKRLWQRIDGLGLLVDSVPGLEDEACWSSRSWVD